jgi:hypothetical protein
MKRWFLAVLALSLAAASAHAESTFEAYGFIMMDAGYNARQLHPDWFDVLRPTKLPSFKDEFGTDGNTFFGVRQTRFGVRSSTPTDLGDLKTQFEWELFGTGADAGQTTIRLRHAYGELGRYGAGQTWSPFMDIDVFPNTIEYWGPNGMVFFRNVQVRFMPIKGDTRMTIALERPGASVDQGIYEDRIELDDVKARFPVPDLSAEYRLGREWGYVELSGILRKIEWEDLGTVAGDLSGSATGWGVHVSSNLKFREGNDVARLSVVYGEAIQNYMNDAPEDVGTGAPTGIPARPFEGEPLPVLGVVAFLDHTWNAKFTTSAGYSLVDVENSDGQAASAFHRGHYAVGNLLYYPAPSVMSGVEVQYGRRENNDDGFTSEDVKVQFSFRYNFSKML